MAKLLQFKHEVLKSILKGIKTLADVVGVTAGPRGRNVVLGKDHGKLESTKDGVTVAKQIHVKDRFENLAVQLAKEAATKTADNAGDGTTTAIILVHALLNEGIRQVLAGVDPVALSRGIQKCTDALIEGLRKRAILVKSSKEIERIATISANNDPVVGSLIAQATEKARGRTIVIEKAKGFEDHIEFVEGTRWDQGYTSPHFINSSENSSVVLENARILLVEGKLSSSQQIAPILEKSVQESSRPLLIVAEGIEGGALNTCVLNKLQGILSIAAVKAPGFGDQQKAQLQDLAVLTGGTVVSEEVGLELEKVDVDILGNARKVVITGENTTLVGGGGVPQDLERRVEQLRSERGRATSKYDADRLETRISNLSGGIVTICIGAPTDVEQKEKEYRAEDALHATRAALEEGFVLGGGTSYLRVVDTLDALPLEGDESLARKVVRKACFAPVTTIARNCGCEGGVIAQDVYKSKGNIGYEGVSGKLCDLVEAGVIDPLLVQTKAWCYASSVSSCLLTTSCMVANRPKKKEEQQDPYAGMGGMGGMM